MLDIEEKPFAPTAAKSIDMVLNLAMMIVVQVGRGSGVGWKFNFQWYPKKNDA